MNKGIVVAVSLGSAHGLSKANQKSIELVKGKGVKGDAHYGATVKHRSRVLKNPTAPNLRQVHLIHKELLDQLIPEGFHVRPGQMAENITTSQIPLLDLPQGTILKIGKEAQIQITGLRNPCQQLNGIKEGLMNALVKKLPNGQLLRRAGVMAIVIQSGKVLPSDIIEVCMPQPPFAPLEPV